MTQSVDYEFTEADLAANRAFEITDRQRVMLQGIVSRFRRAAGWQVITMGLGVSLLVGWYFLAGGTPEAPANGASNGLVLVFAVGFFFVWAIINTVRVQRVSRALGQAQVRTAVGVVRRIEKVNAYVLERAADKPLPLSLDSPAGYRRFQEGKRYRIYYVDFKAGLVLSAERLDEAQNS